MGAVFAGIVRAPMTSMLIIFEMTGGYGLVLPLMIANMSAFALARHWRHTPVYEALLEQDGIFLDQRRKPHGPDGETAVPGTSSKEAQRNRFRRKPDRCGVGDGLTAAACCRGSRRGARDKGRGSRGADGG